MEFKNTIWTYDIGDINDWEDEEGNPMSYEDADELNESYLDDEKVNLDVNVGQIICFAGLGFWDGSREAHKLLGRNVNSILEPQVNGMSYCSWGSDGKDIVGKEEHHDGTNHYTYRILKGETHQEQMKNYDKLFSKKLSPRRISRYTSSLLPAVKNVYGWR